MRIGIVIDSLIPGGAERQALYTVGGLARRGCDVELVYYSRSPHDYDLSAAGEARVTFLEKSRSPLGFMRRLASFLRERDLQVVHSFKSAPCLYGGLAARLAKVPVVLSGYRVEYADRGLIKLGHRVLDRLHSGWVVNSHATVDSLVRSIGADPSRCHVVPNAIDPESFRSELSPEEAKRRLGLDAARPTVAMIAILRPQKNHAMFLDMAARVLKDTPEVQFLVVGDGPERAAVEEGIRRRGLEGSVWILGIRSDVANVLRATDVSVLTSHFEGVPNALMESMAAGLPVVSTRYRSAEELITHGVDGHLVPQDDAGAMATTVQELIARRGRREEIGGRARRAIETRYSVAAMTEALLGVYQSYVDAVRSVREASHG